MMEDYLKVDFKGGVGLGGGLAYFLFRGRYFSAYSFCFLHNLCTIVGRKGACSMRRFEENSSFVIDGFAEIWDSSSIKKLCIQGRFPSEARLFMETLSQIAIKRGFCCKGRLVYFYKVVYISAV